MSLYSAELVRMFSKVVSGSRKSLFHTICFWAQMKFWLWGYVMFYVKVINFFYNCAFWCFQQLFHSWCKQAEVASFIIIFELSCCRKTTKSSVSNPFKTQIILINLHLSTRCSISSHSSSNLRKSEKSSDGDYRPLIALSKLQQHIILSLHIKQVVEK